ncbi:Iron(II)-dependent oxidoreductase EgtB [Variovorax sp. PBS-H4]|uniref:selenoneine synthase SenA n=1 Tax=Variovorax sp. PBS-H4 TaxID=434008 RepID=UPI00131685E0|nr:selenoneine synthase SenA [Variovorax sp. PBS-H4]VTU20215.1 Iron(II)-dependent oxidoreductase EgtB [Variovorax sp. PBS-H4]
MTGARTLAGEALATVLRECRARTRAWTFDLSDAQWQVPRHAGVNLVAWELSHLAWFGEFWVLRGPHSVDAHGHVQAGAPARIAGPDALFDSSRLPHIARWSAALPTREEIAARLDAQLEACLAALAQCDGSDEALYFHRLTLFHEDMHGEAFAWLRATLGYPAPAGVAALPRMTEAPPIEMPAAQARIGWPTARVGFAFDNELVEHPVRLDACQIDASPVTAGRYLRFVEAGGYDDPAFWPGEAGRWRATQPCSHPARWRRLSQQWETRWFDRWLPLDPGQPVIHVSAWEAEAYARWAGRRLPTAAEWEHAAATQPGFAWGSSVWEWTATTFAPYSGFAPGPYRDYSAPWFGDHRELRGGAFATHARLHDPRYRNFFQPGRNDVFAGFRTAAP